MQMASISRWTLSYFSCALVALVAALSLMALGFGYPSEALAAPQTLVVVHLLAIGWLTLLMMGALLQFLPVLVGHELWGSRLAPVALVLVLAGLALLLSGFAAIDGWPGLPSALLPIGGLVLLAGFCVAAAVLMVTLLRAETLPLPAAFVGVGVISILVTAVVGETLAAALSGMIGGEFSLALMTHGVSLHAGFGLGGWLSFAAMGVSYRLVSMFLVAPERKGNWPKAVFWLGGMALAALLMALGVLLATNAPWPAGLAAAGAAALACIGAYLADMVGLYRTRRRRALELHTAAAIGAFAMLILGAMLLTIGACTAQEGSITAAVFVLALGWLSGLGLAMLYKIIPFLTWLECFAPLMGRMATPRVQDLVCEDRAALFFWMYFAAVAVGGTALFFELSPLFRMATTVQLLATLLLIGEFFRARRLADLPLQWCDHPRPRLFLPARTTRRHT